MRPADILMKVGVQHYPSAGDFVAEAMRDGASKRLPGVPTGACQDVTRIFLVHPMACITLQGSIDDLLEEIQALGQRNDIVAGVLQSATIWHTNTDIIAKVHRAGMAQDLLEKYEIRFYPGIFGYFYLAQLQGIIGNEDADLDEALAKAGVVSVFVARTGEDSDGP